MTQRSAVIFDNIPPELRAKRAWLLWRYELNEAGVRIKRPYYPNGKPRRGSATGFTPPDAKRLGSFAQVVDAYDSETDVDGTPYYEGVGLAMSPSLGITIIDLDKCALYEDVTGDNNPKFIGYNDIAKRVLGTKTYVEKSPSGNGLHAIYLGAMINGVQRGRTPTDGKKAGEPVEIYCGSSYVTFTGDLVPYSKRGELGKLRGMPPDLDEDLHEWIARGANLDTSGEIDGIENMHNVPLKEFTLKDLKKVLKYTPEEYRAAHAGGWYKLIAAVNHQFLGSPSAEKAFELTDEWLSEGENYVREANEAKWDLYTEAHKKPSAKPRRTMRDFVKAAIYRGNETAGELNAPQEDKLRWGMAKKSADKNGGIEDEPWDEDEKSDTASVWHDWDKEEFRSLTERPRGAEPLVPHWAYRGTIVLFSSSGGRGKTYTSMLFITHVAFGIDWAGEKTQKGKVLYVSAEDNFTELNKRVWDIGALHGLTQSQVSEKIDMVYVGSDPTPGDKSKQRKPVKVSLYEGKDYDGEFTDNFDELEDRMETKGYDCIVLDNVSKFYMANENSRPMVDQFVSGLIALAARSNACIVLIGHDSKAGAGYSGSTQWHNAARARWSLNAGPNGGPTILKVEKNNYGKTGHAVNVVWDDQFRCYKLGDAVAAPKPDSEKANAQEDAVYIAIQELAEEGVEIAAPSGENSRQPIHAKLKNHDAILSAGGMSAARIKAAIMSLLDEERLFKKTVKRPRGTCEIVFCATGKLGPIRDETEVENEDPYSVL